LPVRVNKNNKFTWKGSNGTWLSASRYLQQLNLGVKPEQTVFALGGTAAVSSLRLTDVLFVFATDPFHVDLKGVNLPASELMSFEVDLDITKFKKVSQTYGDVAAIFVTPTTARITREGRVLWDGRVNPQREINGDP